MEEMPRVGYMGRGLCPSEHLSVFSLEALNPFILEFFWKFYYVGTID